MGTSRLLMELLRISGYILGLVGTYIVTHQLLPDTWLWLTLPKEEWHPSIVVFETCCEVLLVAPLQVLLVAFLIRFLRSLWAGTLREMRPWLLVRAALMGLSFLLLLSTLEANQAGQRIFDARSAAVLTSLRPGLSQTQVEMLIVQSVLAMLRPPERASVEGPDHAGQNLYLKLQDTLARISRGEHVFEASLMQSRVNLHGRLIQCRQKDGKSQENATLNQLLLCERHYMRVSDPQEWYYLLIKFDASTLLQSARYVRLDRHEPRCQILFEIPPTPGKAYPEICSLEQESRNLAF